MDKNKIQNYGDELYEALTNCQMVEPLTDREPDMTIEDAYGVSTRLLERRLDSGETVIGKKIGVTSKAVQNMLNVYQPDFGYLTDAMVYESGGTIPVTEKMIQPKAEGEIAFILKKDLKGPGVTTSDVLQATDFVVPCFEIVDSRVRDWNIKIQDTISDNASCGYFALGNQAADPRKLDLSTVGMVFERNGSVVATGAGAAALGSPLICVAWLANTLGQFDITLKAGEVILSGSLVPLIPIESGDHMTVQIGGIGSASLCFE
ncbi:MAG: 2-oxopent-4-enoate hydratase [Planctomycetes bacterium]|nr:2-oxopent-4-enoate hydratase [Planctomycetota bacterium]